MSLLILTFLYYAYQISPLTEFHQKDSLSMKFVHLNYIFAN